MAFFRDVVQICRIEATLFKRFPKLSVSAVGIIFIPAIYALIYLSSVWDPAAHIARLKVALVNLDEGLTYRGMQVNIGNDVTKSLKEKHTFGFEDYTSEPDAKAAVRQGKLAFALIIPKDFSANAVPGGKAAGGRLALYVSEGNNYNGATIAKRFAIELGHQVNTNLNEKRWALVLTTAAGSLDNLAKLRKGVAALRDGAHQLDDGLAKAKTGSETLATGAAGMGNGVGQLTTGMKQLGAGLRTMDEQRPQAQDLGALKSGAAELVKGHVALGNGLLELQSGAQKLAEGADKLRDETKGIPFVGERIADGASQLESGAKQLGGGIQSASAGEAQLGAGAQKLSTGVGKLTDGVTALGNGIHTASSKMPPDATLDQLTNGGRTLAGGTQEFRNGLIKLKKGSAELASGMDLLDQSLPADINAPDGSARGLADSVEPALEIVAPVANNGAGFAPNFLPVALWLGAVMTAFIFHLRRLPIEAQHASKPAQLLGKIAILVSIVLAQAIVVLLMSLFLLDLHVSQLWKFVVTLMLTSVTFLLIIIALTRAFGDTGKAVALILLIVQLSSAGGIFPVELSGGFFQNVSPWLPFTWVVKALRACMFDAFDGTWLHAWLLVLLSAFIALVCACFAGRWKFVGPDEHRPALDI